MQVELTWTMSPDTCLFGEGAFKEMHISVEEENSDQCEWLSSETSKSTVYTLSKLTIWPMNTVYCTIDDRQELLWNTPQSSKEHRKSRQRL